MIKAPTGPSAPPRADESPGYDLGPLPDHYLMRVVDERVVESAVAPIFAVARDVEHWPRHLAHYRYVRFRERRLDGGGLAYVVAVPDAGGDDGKRRGRWPGDPFPPCRRGDDGDGGRVVVPPPGSQPDPGANRAPMARTTMAARRRVRCARGYRAGIRPRDRLAHLGGTSYRGR